MLVLVYVGAVMVLFLFVVMMLDINLEELRQGFTRFAWLGWLTALAVIVEIVGRGVGARRPGASTSSRGAHAAAGRLQQHRRARRACSTPSYAYPFELAAMLLLVAIVAAIALTMRRRAGLKEQDIDAQVAVRREDRVRLVKMEAEKRP